MDCTIEGVTFKVNEFEIVGEIDCIVMSVHKPDNTGGGEILHSAMLEGRYLDTLLHDGDYIYKFLAIVGHGCDSGVYYMQSCAKITLTSIGE